MKKLMVVFAIVLFGSLSLAAQSRDEIIIRSILFEQAKAWNKGNIDAFMDTYWKADSLMFIGKSGLTYGWQQARDNYKKGYPDTVAMGKLNFNLLEVKRLSVMYFFVVGKWYLTRSIGDLNGTFTLLIKKIKNKWVIISDHSS